MGLQGRAWSPSSREPWMRGAAEDRGIGWTDGTPGIVPGLRGAGDGEGRCVGGDQAKCTGSAGGRRLLAAE